MSSIEPPIILREDDYQLLLSFLNDGRYASKEDARNALDLGLEIRKATLVTKDQFPRDVVRLNSKIRIMQSDRNALLDLTLVTPDKADIKERKISVLAPIGTALLGLKKGTTIIWEVPAGKKELTVVEVNN
ncbi:MAG TPA: GreA/GreB family elongation factor [Puia sp.]|jgi:regulator of nucleoside diphosphate kinase|nr:GreA/GreB family elongation factor [Puia sp.]